MRAWHSLCLWSNQPDKSPHQAVGGATVGRLRSLSHGLALPAPATRRGHVAPTEAKHSKTPLTNPKSWLPLERRPSGDVKETQMKLNKSLVVRGAIGAGAVALATSAGFAADELSAAATSFQTGATAFLSTWQGWVLGVAGFLLVVRGVKKAFRA